MTNNKNHYHL